MVDEELLSVINGCIFKISIKICIKVINPIVKKQGERNTTIDRINPNGNYTKENCRWNTLWNQNLNRANNHLLTYKGETKPLTQWARKKGFKRGLLENRIRRGWSIKKMLETPVITKFSH